MQPTITVLMSVFNEDEHFLKMAIESVFAQTYTNWEFLIIDDGSTLKTCIDTLKQYASKDARVRIITHKQNLGLTLSLNHGLKEARGTYIARLDSNDLAHPTRLEKQQVFMEQHQKHALCGSWTYLVNTDNEIVGEKKFATNYAEIRKKILYFNFFTHSSLFFHKDIVKRLGGYTQSMKKAQDYDLLLKLAGKFPIANLPEFLCFYRVSPNSISSAQYKKQEFYAVTARLRALLYYHYSAYEVYKIIIPLLSLLLIPAALKKYIIQISSKLI